MDLFEEALISEKMGELHQRSAKEKEVSINVVLKPGFIIIHLETITSTYVENAFRCKWEIIFGFFPVILFSSLKHNLMVCHANCKVCTLILYNFIT